MPSFASITLRNHIEELARLQDFVTAYCREHGFASTELSLVAEEGFVNVVEHGFEDTAEHEIEVSLVLEGGFVTMAIEDDGVAFNPLTAPPFDSTTPLEFRRNGGFGIHLIRNLMDEIEYQRSNGRNRLITRKRQDPPR